MGTSHALRSLVAATLLACIAGSISSPVMADAPTVGGGWYEMWVSSVYLVPDDYRGGPMKSIQSLAIDHSYSQTYLDGQPPSSAQTVGSLLLNCYDIPFADLQLETTYSNIPINAGCSVGGSINYKFVAYNKIGLELPWDVRVPLIATGYVSTSITNGGNWDYAYAESTITTSDGATIDLVARSGSGGSGGDAYLPLDQGFYVHPDEASLVILSVALNTAFDSEEPVDGYKEFHAIADPNIYVDPTAMISVNGTDYKASDVFGVAFSPGFMVPVPEPSTIAALISGGIGLGVLGAMWRRRRATVEAPEPFFQG